MQAGTGDRSSLYCTFIVWIQCNKIYCFSSLKGNTPMLKKYTWSWCMGNQKQPPTTTPRLRLLLHIPTSTWSTYFAPHPEKRHLSYTEHGFCPYIRHHQVAPLRLSVWEFLPAQTLNPVVSLIGNVPGFVGRKAECLQVGPRLKAPHVTVMCSQGGEPLF